MARSTSRSRSRSTSKKVKIDLSNVGKQFEEDQEYAVEVKEATQEEGNEYPYFKLVFVGMDEEYANSQMYHNASTSPQSLWRLKPLLEALGMDIPDDEFELEASDFVGKQCMVSTISERKPGGGSSIKPDEFWPLDDAGDKEDKKSAGKKSFKKDDDEGEIDLDAMSDDDINALAEEFSIDVRGVTKKRAELAKCDPNELADACKDLGIDLGGSKEEEEKPARGRRGAKDEEDEKPARGRRSSSKDEDEEEKPARNRRSSKDEDEEAPKGRSQRGSSSSKKKSADKIPEAEVDEMSEEELEELLEKNDIDLDLSEHRTLRKKKNAVKDALEEAGLLDN